MNWLYRFMYGRYGADQLTFALIILFLRVLNPVKNWFKSANQNFKAHQEYKYFKCPNCKQKLRAPRGRGKIQVTCQRCRHQFIKKV